MNIIEAMKAKTAENLDDYVENPAWVAEEKYDGTRYLAYVRGDDVRIISRRGVDKTDRLPQLYAQFIGLARTDSRIARGAIFDGEVIADGGFLQTMSLVGSLGSRGIHKTVGYKYMVFDILMIDGMSIGHNPMIKRRQLLQKLLTPPTLNIMITPQFPMSYAWLKVKAVETADGVIMGFNPGEGKYSDTIGSIQIGQWVNPTDAPEHDLYELTHVTNISGMTDEMRYSLGPQDIGKVVEFAYQLKTKDSYRHPRFKRFRPDKPAWECIWDG